MAKGGLREWTIAHVQIKNDDVLTKSSYLINLAKRNDKWWPICLYIYQSHPFRNSWIQPATFLRILARETTKVEDYSREAKVSVVFFWGALRLLIVFFGFKQFSDRAKKNCKATKTTCRFAPGGCWLFWAISKSLFFDHMHQDGPTWSDHPLLNPGSHWKRAMAFWWLPDCFQRIRSFQSLCCTCSMCQYKSTDYSQYSHLSRSNKYKYGHVVFVYLHVYIYIVCNTL